LRFKRLPGSSSVAEYVADFSTALAARIAVVAEIETVRCRFGHHRESRA